MNEHRQLPLPLAMPWPVGLRLRFKLDAIVRLRYAYLRGSPVLVLSPLRFIPDGGDWRQYIAAFGARHPEEQFGWALPEQLELIPGQPGDPAFQIGVAADREAWIRQPCLLHTDRIL